MKQMLDPRVGSASYSASESFIDETPLKKRFYNLNQGMMDDTVPEYWRGNKAQLWFSDIKLPQGKRGIRPIIQFLNYRKEIFLKTVLKGQDFIMIPLTLRGVAIRTVNVLKIDNFIPDVIRG
jgi:hypothetical protein